MKNIFLLTCLGLSCLGGCAVTAAQNKDVVVTYAVMKDGTLGDVVAEKVSPKREPALAMRAQ